MGPLVSIVTPVYNEAAHLNECLDSILAQTYQNWECIIVDNCSVDSSAEVARRYAANDSRIRVVTNQELLPAIRNHNTALRQISAGSKYCKVVFADDWIFPECLARMVAVAEAHPSVGIVSGYTLEGRRVTLAGLPYRDTVMSGREICRLHLLENLFLFGSANSLLYRADLVRAQESFFNEANIHADTEVCFALLRTCDFGFVHQVLTFTRVRPGSLSSGSADIQSDFACTLRVLKVYGADYLTKDELEACLDRHLAEYYRYLGKNVFLGRHDGFWQAHKNGLIEAGGHFSRLRLGMAALSELGAALLSPRETMRRISARRGRPSAAVPSESVLGKVASH